MYGTNMTVRKRLTLTFILASLAFVFLMGRLAWVQFVHGEELQEKALEVRMRDIPVEAKRGSILDRNGKELVISISVDSIYATPGQVEDPRAAADKIAPILEMDADKLYEKLNKHSSFEWIERKVDNETASMIKALNLDGIGFVEESKRHYLDPGLAPHVLGFAGVDNQGLTGIERSYDEELRGQPGRIVIEHDAAGRPVPEALHQYIPAKQGHDLVLTIDETIQYFVERELDNVVTQYNPKFALAIVMDPETGGILAMGNRPSFNPNDWSNEPREVWDKNPAIWYNYEPGSTFKIITAAAALEEDAVKPEDQFFDPGYIKVADRTIRCHKAGGHGSQTFVEVVQNSCNPGFIEVGLDVGIKRYYKYLDAFGFGSTTGIKLPGEAGGIVIPEDKATNLNLATISMGQSIAVTPIQLISAVAAVANDGVMMQPQLVQEISANGKTIFSMKPEKVRQVIAEDTARQLRGLLENVVANGTGRNAFVEGYRVGGKTGTAQVVGESGGYVSGRYVASFAGFAPADDPKMVMLVVIAEPQGGVYYGGLVAAPVFQAIARDTLRYMRLPEIPGLEKPVRPYEYVEPHIEVSVPDVVNYPADEACRIIKAAGLQCTTHGEGNLVRQQTPGPGAIVDGNTTVILDLEPATSRSGGGTVIVPNLQGRTIKEAGYILEEIGLRPVPEGSGVAIRQSYNAGAAVKRGAPVRVVFEPPGDGSEKSFLAAAGEPQTPEIINSPDIH
ncbi:MAG: stage V sporulation protein D [Peptococcaceae bacterium BRH_c8a]|nr:MAG: stage V sporulation protein D [Peptococcaceae bacterium BRH_c8a]